MTTPPTPHPTTIEQHFPWYADPTDTDNIDCQCGHPIAGGIAEWATHLATTLTTPQQPRTAMIQRHGGPDSPWQYCGDPHCQDCQLLGITT